MAFRPFTQKHVFKKLVAPKERDKASIHSLECYGQNLYIGTKNASVQHLIFPRSSDGDQHPGQWSVREGRTRKLGSTSSVAQLRAVPLFNHLLVLCDRSIAALNMFSLEPIPALKKIQHVSLFEVWNPLLPDQTPHVQMVTSSSRRKVIQIHVVGVDSWEVMKEILVLQDPVALAVDGSSMCYATTDKYLLCDIHTGSSEELFPHSHSRQQAIVFSVGQGEFLLNGPEYLGMFVMKTGTCQRPPLQWPREVLAAAMCFPYIVTLQPQFLSIYSMVDLQQKQTVNLQGAKGLLSASDGVLVFTERETFSLRLVPFQEQIQALVQEGKVEEASLLLDGVQAHCLPDSCKQELQQNISCLAGFAKLYKQDFSEAKDLFIKGHLDPREIIQLYPDMQSIIGIDFHSQLHEKNKIKDLRSRWEEDRSVFLSYLYFLEEFLLTVRDTQQVLASVKEVDSALLRLYVELGDAESLQQFVASPNKCELDLCVPVLEKHKRFYALGSLFQSHGKLTDAIQIGVHIFTGRRPEDQVESGDVLALLEEYPLAMLLYLEFLIHNLKSEEERHHNYLALAYADRILQVGEEMHLKTREKLQQHLWESKFYDISIVLYCGTLDLASKFLFGSFRETLHQRRMTMLQKALSEAELMRHNVMRMQASKTKFRLDRGQTCDVCQKEFAEPQFCSLHGNMMHLDCAGS
ncbi:Transforming growth factor-beta receptor-associated protein 1 [Takifugu flavidus]|uniref:Transforming growth factor-beta receptor-associated protein 1 n=1 Tax=Takifugu flavidus TaxID=433684 RepID=A0A5C6MEL3_9TELE|nr:Transforming growth factor-beta receptor-associated protein 1 [Takifugu flavidus]